MIDINDRYLFYRSFYSINSKTVMQEKEVGMRGLCHVFSWLTQCNQAFPLAECSEENPVPYSAGNR
ncbi:hypothetical protein ACX6FC_004553, partial [Escherichia coli]